MFFSRFFFHAKEVLLPANPQEFAQALIAWATAHENSSLILSYEVLDYMKLWSLSYYNGSCIIVVLRECVIIANRLPLDGEIVVVLDEVLLTYPDHKVLFNRQSGKINPVKGIYISHLGMSEE